MSERRVEVLVFDGCPNVDATLERARAAIARSGLPTDLRLVRVESDEAARSLRFLGSPTVRVDGADVDPTARGREDFGLQCRVYTVDGRLEGAPPSDWILAALRGESWQDAPTPARPPRAAAPPGVSLDSFAAPGRGCVRTPDARELHSPGEWS